MPIYDYQCNDCRANYDVFHKVREVVEDVVCPSCGSTRHTRLISAPNVAVSSGPGSAPSSCAENFGGSCCGGAYAVN
jgi:putative FmdB family regulatory protein